MCLLPQPHVLRPSGALNLRQGEDQEWLPSPACCQKVQTGAPVAPRRPTVCCGGRARACLIQGGVGRDEPRYRIVPGSIKPHPKRGASRSSGHTLCLGRVRRTTGFVPRRPGRRCCVQEGHTNAAAVHKATLPLPIADPVSTEEELYAQDFQPCPGLGGDLAGASSASPTSGTAAGKAWSPRAVSPQVPKVVPKLQHPTLLHP